MSVIEKWWKSRKLASAAEENSADPAALEQDAAAKMDAAADVPAETADTDTSADGAAEESVEEKAAADNGSGTVEEAAEDTDAAEESGIADEAAETPGIAAEEIEESMETAPESIETAEPAATPEETAVTVTAEDITEPAAAPEEAAGSLLDTLEPADVFGYFREISAIPHGSFNTKAISDYLEDFAKARELDYIRDEKGNLIICRPGSEGYENAEPIALQGHIDMVCEKESSNPIDMETEAITLITDGEWLWADRTTLGGDDGIAAAIMMALLADDSITCPPLECVFTVDEEVGMLGAFAMDLSSLRSRRMINLDSEQEGIITAACAGGAEEICSLPGKRREKKGEVLEIMIEGLRGGHSGECIGIGRANASILLARLLYRLEKEGKYCLVNFHGGTRDNAIPREAKAEIIFTGSFQRAEIKDVIAGFAKEIEREYSVADPDIHVRAKWPDKGRKIARIAFTRKDTRRMIRFLMALPNGVLEFTPLYRDVPQTSLSLGIVNTVADGMRTHSLVRSSINSQKQMVMDKIESIAMEFGASVETEGTYPAWELIEKSDFRDLAAEVYKETSGAEPTVCVIHGGLECGLLAAKVPGLDCISIGPDMEEIHTPAERLNIPSSRRIYDYVKALLEACVKG